MKKSVNYREIMENKLGRKLLSTEIVHHKDGDSHNNNPDNLEITDIHVHPKKRHLKSSDWEKVISEMLELDIQYKAQALNEDLDIFFTSRQKEIILRKLYRLGLSKTEKEYYSRTIKPKMRALKNNLLFKLANYMIE